jgi:hypothetical protein
MGGERERVMGRESDGERVRERVTGRERESDGEKERGERE